MCMNSEGANAAESPILQRLLELQDPDYRLFQCRLMPTVDPETVIGVRTPALRQLAKQLNGSPEAAAFLAELPHRYYDENNLHGFLIEKLRDYDTCVAAVNAFLPYVDNWATCDLMSPKVFARHLPELWEQIGLWVADGRTYPIRFGLEMLMCFFLDGERFRPEGLELAAGVRSEEYYVRMMVAWLFATALAKQWEATRPYIEQHRLDTWTHNKAIQKATESYRISPEQKAYLRSLKDTRRS